VSRDEVERLAHDPVQVRVRASVALELDRSPDRGEALDEIRRRGELDAERGQQLGGAGVEPRAARQLVARTVLGGEPPAVAHQPLHLGAVLLPRPVVRLAARQVVEHRRLEVVDQAAGLALARHEVVAAARHQLAAGQAEQVEADRIVALEGGEEPAVELGLAQGALDVGDAIGEHDTSGNCTRNCTGGDGPAGAPAGPARPSGRRERDRGREPGGRVAP
jgi:hypothetical protein